MPPESVLTFSLNKNSHLWQQNHFLIIASISRFISIHIYDEHSKSYQYDGHNYQRLYYSNFSQYAIKYYSYYHMMVPKIIKDIPNLLITTLLPPQLGHGMRFETDLLYRMLETRESG